MALTFNMLLRACGIDPVGVRLLRHEMWGNGRSSYSLWRDHRASFDRWQEIQKSEQRSYFTGTHWASFVVSPIGKTIFAGLYEIGSPVSPSPGSTDPFTGGILDPEWIDVYPTRLSNVGLDYIGRLAIEWGRGTRTWRQRAANQDKRIVELAATTIDPPFPGFASFLERLSDLASLPLAWRVALESVGGVYVLTCPATREHYVGAAHGARGFLGRWQVHAAVGGDAALFRTRAMQDYNVGILQVAGSDATAADVLRLESRWKDKLQSRAMGLNAA